MNIDDHRQLAASLYNACWTLLETTDRDPAQDVELLTDAFASRHHWLIAGTNEQWITSDWMVARAAGETGHGALAVLFAHRAADAAAATGVPDWLVASCSEGLARAYDAAGDVGLREHWRSIAETQVAAIADEEDRSLIAEQLDTVAR